MKKTTKNIPQEQPKPFSATDVIKYALTRSCIYFTAITVIILAAQIILIGASEKTIEPSRFLLIYPFTLAFSLADCIFKARALGITAKVFIHYAVAVFSFYAFVYAPTKSEANPVVIIVFLSAVYFIIATPFLIVRAVNKKKKEKAVPYQSIYSKK